MVVELKELDFSVDWQVSHNVVLKLTEQVIENWFEVFDIVIDLITHRACEGLWLFKFIHACCAIYVTMSSSNRFNKMVGCRRF